MSPTLLLLRLAFVSGLLQQNTGRPLLYYFEADDYVQEGNEWSMWFVPAESSAVSSVGLRRDDSTTEFLLFCFHTLQAPPQIELSFSCQNGCLSVFCSPNDTYGFRIDGSVWHVYVRNARPELEATYILEVTFYGSNQSVVHHTGRLVVARAPKISPSDISCSIKHFENALRSPSAEILEEKHFRRTINKDPLTEGEWISGEILLSLGDPKGKVGAYIVKLVRNVSEPELLTCQHSIQDQHGYLDVPNPAKLTFRCLLTAEHVGMAIVAANALRRGYTAESALKTVKNAILNSVAPWLTKTKREIPEIDGIYGYAHLLVQLFVGWRAVVRKWHTAQIVCSLPDERVISVSCTRTRVLREADRGKPLEKFYTYIYFGQKYVVMQKYGVYYNDSGVYSCTAARCDRKLGCIIRPVCTDRRLFVSPSAPDFRTYLAYEYHSTFKNFSRRLYAYNPYHPINVYGGRTYALLCSVFRNTTYKGTKMQLKYTHYDPVTNIPTELKVIKLKETIYWGDDGRDRIHQYYLLGDQPMPMYAGRQVAECQVTYLAENANLPSWMIDPNDINGNLLLRVLGSRSLELRFHQGATGELQFESETPYFEEHPVPLGTRIRCKGGAGFPLLGHSWTFVSPGRYHTDDPYKQYASTLPLQHGGYEQGQRVFRDIYSFKQQNMIDGDTVTIPFDTSLRGMSFLFRCEGTNTDFQYRTHKISRLLHLTVCICQERMNVIDISMIVSSQLLPSVKMGGSWGENEDIDFYGKRYLTLLRQIILGLPQSSELARISIVPTTILGDLKRHPLYRKALDFRHNLTRFQLVEGLTSENIRPTSLFIAGGSCPYKYPVRMDEAIRAIPETFPPIRPREERKRPHIILYPMDPWNKIDSPSITLQILKKLQNEGSKLVMVYFFNKSHSDWKDSTHGLSSIYYVDLMPQSEYGGKKCRTMSEEDEEGLIDRFAMFKTICSMARSASIKGTITPGFLYFSLPYRMQLPSAKLTISCMSRLDPFEAYKRQMRLCLANYDAVQGYKLGRSSVEDLDNTCIKHLLTTDFSKPEDSCISLHYEMILQDSHNGLFAVCYRRTRDMEKELASFAIRPIRLTSIPLTDPSLVIAHWPHKSGDSAELQCVVDVSIPPFQVDLVYNPNGTLDFIVVVRKMTAFTLGQIGRKASVRLVWLNVPSNAGNADLFCFISRPGMKARHLKSLPNVTATLKISKPTRHHFDGGCPQAPVIKRLFTRPLSDETAPPQLGNRLSLICEAETGTENAPMQMAYADNETRFVICSGGEHDARDDVPTALEIPLACWFADWSKGGCFQRPDAMYSNHELANFTACKIKRRPHFHNAIRVIEFVIPLLQVKHFGGFVFCETVPWKFVGKGVQGERRLLSEALENYFDVEPQILSMEVSLLGWRCLVIACPPAEETTLETIVAHPQSLRRALAGTQLNILHESKSMKWRMSKEAAYFFPTPYLASINESNSSMPFITRLFRAPPNPAHVAEGGLATVECSVTQNYKDDHRTASERIHISYPRSSKAAHRPSGTTLIPSSGVVEPNSSWGIRCPLTSIFSSTAMHMYLLYKSELGPWNFIGIPLIRIKLQTDVDLGKRVRVESFRPVGLWMNKPLEDLTVTLFSPGGTNVVEITVKNAKIEHAGRYFCRYHQFNAYHEAWPDQELFVLRVKQPPIMGYRQQKPGTWMFQNDASPLIQGGTQITSRCLSWQPDHQMLGYKMQPPYLARFKTPNSLMYEVHRKELSVKVLRPTASLLFHVVDYKFLAEGSKDFNMSIGCFLTLDQQESKEYKINLNDSIGPLMVCVPPQSLLIMPDDRFIFYEEDQLECSSTDHVFPEPTVTWSWVLGPLPKSPKIPAKGDWTTQVKSNILQLSRLPGPGFYIYRCTVESTCVRKTESATINFRFIISEPDKTFDIVQVSPVLAIVPEVIQFNCPSIITPVTQRTETHQNVFVTNLTWFRTTRQINFTQPEFDPTYQVVVKQDFVNKNVWRPTPHFKDSDRVLNFRQENELRVNFAMEIGPSSGTDYGFYGCITEISDEEKLTSGFRFTQHAPRPACLILENDLPKLDLTAISDEGVSMSKACFTAEEIVQVECTVPAYQTFCDDSDKPLGRTIIGTQAYLQFVYTVKKLDEKSYDEDPRIIPLNVSADITVPQTKPDDLPRAWLKHNKYTFKVSWRHDQSVLSCHTVPLLQTYFRESPLEEEAFRRDFERLRPIIKRSTGKKICVYYPPRNILVDPPPPDQISRKDVKFTIARGTQITCSVDGHPVPSVDMDIYPLRTAKLGIALDKGLGDLDSWMDLSQPNVDWPISSRKGEANVTVGHSRAPPDVVYVGVCQAESTINAQRFTVQRMFFFRVLVASKVTQKRKTFDLTLAALIICVLAFIVVSTLRELLILLKRSRSDGNRARQKVLDPTAEKVGSPTAVNPVGDQYVLAENADDNVLRNRSFQ